MEAKNGLSRFWSGIKRVINKAKIHEKLLFFNSRYFLCTFILSVALILIIETICRHSFIGTLLFVIKNPVMFVYNIMIIFFLMLLGHLFRRRVLYAGIISFLLIVLGTINGVLLCFRTTPFSAVDFLLIGNVMTIIDLYLSVWNMISIAAGILAAIVICVIAGIKCPKFMGKLYRIPTIVFTTVYLLAIVGLDSLLIFVGISTENYSNLANAYEKYGFTYCFAGSIFKLGMDEPDNYNPEKIEEIIENKVTLPGDEDIQDADDTGEDVLPVQKDCSHPNIIVVQLESFFDVDRVIGLEMSQDPIPNFHALMDKYSSGYLYVPSIGAGTANTEFEVLTGMNMDFFGPGEYPYKTILKTTTCESIAYNLRNHGYAAHAIHNNDGTFYDRHIVYSQLGFESFTAIEYMYDYERNINNFCKDIALKDEIMLSINSTQERDCVFAVSVQAHGEYPSERRGDKQPIFIRYKQQSKENAWSYFINQLHEVDAFIGEMIKTIEEFEEPTIVVFYGDHLPSMGLITEDVSNGRLTATEYVMYSNFDMPCVNKDMEAYQLQSYVLGKMELSEGVMNSFHQNSRDDVDYLENMELLQYDMLYGTREVYDGNNPYVATAMHMGNMSRNIKIHSVAKEEDGSVYVRGKFFNKYSVVYKNGNAVSTVLIDSNTLKITGIEPEKGDTFTVAQVGADKFALSYCDEYEY